MEISTTQRIEELKEEGVEPLYSIRITEQTQDDRTFDVEVWDEIEDERDDDLEKARLQTYEEARSALNQIVEENPNITFIRLADWKN